MTAGEIYQGWIERQFAPDRSSDIRAHLPRLKEASRGTVVEIGVDRGVSTSALLAGVEENGGMVTSIDISPHCQAIATFSGHQQWKFVCANSRHCAEIPEAIDTLLIDSSHDYADTLKELHLYGPRVRGVMFLHDTENKLYPGVLRAVNEWMTAEMTLTLHKGSFGMAEIRRK